MSAGILAAILLVLTLAAFYVGRGRAVAAGAGSPRRLHSVPTYYGLYVALWCAVPGFILLLAWLAFEPVLLRSLVIGGLPPAATEGLTPPQIDLLWAQIQNLSGGHAFGTPDPTLIEAAERLDSWRRLVGWSLVALCLAAAAAGLAYARQRIRPEFRARTAVERTTMVLLVACSVLAVFTTLGIVLSLLFESLRFFRIVPVWEFLFGLHWSPQMAIREDQVGSSGAFGAVPVFAGTLLISLIAMLVATPIGLFSAIYMADYASPRFRSTAKPIIEILAGIPTVVYGFFAILTVAPAFRAWGEAIGLDMSANSALVAGLVMGVMIIPYVSSLSDDVINAVPQSLRDGSAALGATRSETIRQVVLPAALPGIVGALLLAASRAIGETMIVVMAAGLTANLTANPFEAVTTVTVQIVANLTGDQEFDNPKTLSAFALGFALFLVTLCLNVVALRIVQKYREKYD